MKNIIRSILAAAFLASSACSHPAQSQTHASLPEEKAAAETDTRYIFTMGQLNIVMAGLTQFPVGEVSCKDSNLPMAIDVHGTLYELLMEQRGLAVNVDFRLTEKDLLSIIPEGTALVFSYAAGDKLCVWLIDNKGRRAFGEAQNGHRTVERLLATFYRAGGIEAEQLSRMPVKRDAGAIKFSSRKVDIPTQNVLNALSSAVFPGQVRDSLSDYDRLVIVPYGTLGTVPSAALPTSNGRALVEQAEIIIAPSLYDFHGAMRAARGESGWRFKSPGCQDITRSAATGAPVIVGDPNYTFDPDFIMPPLPGAEAEAKAVAALFGVAPLIGDDATMEALQSRLEGAPLLYLATHCVSYEAQGVESFVALTRGRLAGKNIQNLCLDQTRLAVLSACQTGLGQTVEGGTISLARSFQKAGVESVAMSLWNVEDEATRDLMTGFAARVRDGDSPSAAMRAAMLDTRKRFPAPRQWASFLIFSAHVGAAGN